MRFNEKTYELNFCAQASALWAPHFRTLWWGLTQEQEKAWGFDAATKAGRKHFIFQFKTLKRSAKQAQLGLLRYVAEHQQMVHLRRRANRPGVVFYALPTLDTMGAFVSNPDLIQQTWLLDVHRLPATIHSPTGIYAKANRRTTPPHVITVTPPTATVRSEPMTAPVWKHETQSQSVFAVAPEAMKDGLSDRELSNFIEGADKFEVTFPHTYIATFLPK